MEAAAPLTTETSARSAKAFEILTPLEAAAGVTAETEARSAVACKIITPLSEASALELSAEIAITLSSRLMISSTDEATMAERTPEGVLSRQTSSPLPLSETPIAIKHRDNPHSVGRLQPPQWMIIFVVVIRSYKILIILFLY